MIFEEFRFNEIGDYLRQNIDLLICGIPGQEERSRYFHNEWQAQNKDILALSQIDENRVFVKYTSINRPSFSQEIDLNVGIPYILNILRIQERNVIIDMSGLNHVLIMYITKVLICQIVPKTLFSSYIRPHNYRGTKDEYVFSLTDQFLGVKAVPGFSRREKEDQILCAFIGFEGIRLKAIMESLHNINKLLPIVAFPSGLAQWYNISMWNSMDILKSNPHEVTVYTCFSESIFMALSLMNAIIPTNCQVFLAPIGTRAHSMACSIYACHHSNVGIVYDYAMENEERAQGISEIMIYHISSFLKI